MLETDPESQPERSTGPIAAAIAAGAVAAIGLVALRSSRDRDRHAEGNAISPEAGLRRSLTISADVQDLKERWRDPRTLERILEPTIEVEPAGPRQARWRLALPAGRALEWNMELLDDVSDRLIWRSIDDLGLPNVVEATFGPATGGRGTVMTLRLDFTPPLGAAGRAAVRLFAKPIRIAALGALYRFRALVQTGEVPVTSPQPAARRGGIDS